jgi:dTMP kinase
MDHLESELLPTLNEGITVVCDRYDHSSVAYQSVAGGGPEAIAWIRELNRHARRPDLTLVLCVPPAVAAQRRKQRQGRAEIFDDDRLQQALCAFYERLGEHFQGERIVPIDAVGSTEQVGERVRAAVQAVVAT